MSPWGIERFDLDAYLGRIGYGGDLGVTVATLHRLHRAHAATTPFENLDIVLGRPIPIDIESVQRKLVGRGRGGYCHEHNPLFAALLERLGYPVTRLAGQVRPDRSGPRTHMLPSVRAVANHYTSTHPASPFVGTLMALRTGLRHRLVGRELTTTSPDGTVRRHESTAEEIPDSLRDTFDISVGSDEAAVLTRVLSQHTQEAS